MKTIINQLLLIMVTALACSAQSLSPSVIALAGGYEKTPSGATVSWTLGEPIVDPLRAGNVLLTQGFQQPDLKVFTGFEDPSFEHSLSTFPNPMHTELIMQTTYDKPLQFRMVDLSGKLVTEGSWSTKNTLDVSQFSSGIYAIYFLAEGRMIKSDLLNKQ